jgi:hypothetical protein
MYIGANCKTMSREFDFIKDLTKDREIWKIAARVVDSWDVIGINGHPHLEMVIVDAKVNIPSILFSV